MSNTRTNVRTKRRAVGLGAAIAVGTLVAVLPNVGASAATSDRVAGVDRYETAVKISQESGFTSGVRSVVLATGEDFPDALAAAPVAARATSPILLTRPNDLPASTRAEIDRLNPGQIVVVGGAGAISGTVFDELQQYTTGEVRRVEGATRYATAARMSFLTNKSLPADTVYIATGQNYPDALAGGSVAANAPKGAAILLVEKDSIPAPTAAELDRLDANKVIILGGTGAVSDAVQTALDPYSVEPVTRVTGTDRYLTSVEISKSRYTNSTRVYLATGANFPDALAGSARAGIGKAPVLLVQPDCIPPAVDAEITRLNPNQIVVLGGTGVLSDAILNRFVCGVGTTSTTAATTSTTAATTSTTAATTSTTAATTSTTAANTSTTAATTPTTAAPIP